MFDYSESPFFFCLTSRTFPPHGQFNAYTLSPDRPLGFNFIPPCQRQDFGDTNFAAKNQWNPVNKLRTDWRFCTDMWAVCDNFTGWENVLKRATCMVVASKYAIAAVVFHPVTDL